MPENDGSGHRTKMAGIIAAKRNNNEIGVAGIAGGDWDNDIPGAKIVNYKILSNTGHPQNDPDLYYTFMNLVFEAMIAGSTLVADPRINIYNCSWGVNEPIHIPGLPVSQSCYDECALMITFLAQQGSVIVASAGNDATTDYPQYPATTRPSGQGAETLFIGHPDEFVVCVSGSNENGLHHPSTNKGYFVDLIAPAATSHVQTTNKANVDAYGSADGASAAVAHVSGVCALLHDYLTWSEDAVNAVSIPVAEDYEKILSNSAFDIVQSTDPELAPLTAGYYEGWDLLSANGILNARAAMEYVNLSNHKIWHFNAVAPTVTSTYAGDWVLGFTQEYNVIPGMIGRPSGEYLCETYQLNALTTHNIFGETMLDNWPLHSQSNTYDYFDDGLEDFRINQFPQVNLQACSETGANLRAYTFKIKHHLSTPLDVIDVWYPIEPSQASMHYSVYTETAPTNIESATAENGWKFSIYPNPAANQLFLKLPGLNSSYLKISIYDLSGKLVISEEQRFNGSGNFIKILDVSALSTGVYLCSVENEKGVETLKFIKD